MFFGKSRVARAEEEVRAGLPALLPRLWRFGLALSRDGDLAEELTQAACVRALERARQFEPGSRLDRWLFAILRSIWLNELRARRTRRGEGHVPAEEALVFDGARQLEANILAARVLKEVAALPESQREAVFLVYVEGLTYREAAEIMEVPIGTVMSRLAAARLKLAGRGAGGSQAQAGGQ